jgi:hypothetical protein
MVLTSISKFKYTPNDILLPSHVSACKNFVKFLEFESFENLSIKNTFSILRRNLLYQLNKERHQQ